MQFIDTNKAHYMESGGLDFARLRFSAFYWEVGF